MDEEELRKGLTAKHWEVALTTLEKWSAEAEELGHPFLINRFESGLSEALRDVSEAKNVALDVIKTVVAEHLQETPEDWQRQLLSWAKKNDSGVYRPGYWDGYELTYEHNQYLRSIGRL